MVDDECDPGDEDEDSDQAGEQRVLGRPDDPGTTAEDAGDQVLRDPSEPRGEKRVPPELFLRVVDLEASRIVRRRAEREGRVAIGAEGAVAVEVDAPGQRRTPRLKSEIRRG